LNDFGGLAEMEYMKERRPEENKCPSDDTLTKCKEVFNNAFPETLSEIGAEVFIRNCAYDLCMMSDKGDAKMSDKGVAQVSIQLK
jgi:hypothetical protein